MVVEFDKCNIKVIGVFVDLVEDYGKWKVDIEKFGGVLVNFLMIDDIDLIVVKVYDMFFVDYYLLIEGCILVYLVMVWIVFIIGLDKKVWLIMIYLMFVGCNFVEILWVLDVV